MLSKRKRIELIEHTREQLLDMIDGPDYEIIGENSCMYNAATETDIDGYKVITSGELVCPYKQIPGNYLEPPEIIISQPTYVDVQLTIHDQDGIIYEQEITEL